MGTPTAQESSTNQPSGSHHPNQAPSPPYVQATGGVWIIRPDQFNQWARDVAAPILRGGVGQDETTTARLGDTNPLDPRGLGITGPLPKATDKLSASQLDKLFDQGGLARPLEQIASDTWGDGWTPSLDPPNEKWAKDVADLEDRLGFRERREEADVEQLLHGVSLLYFNLAEAGSDPAQDTKGKVRKPESVLGVQVIHRSAIEDIVLGKDTKDARFQKPVEFKIRFDGTTSTKVHWSRALLIRERRKRKHAWDGVGIGRRCAAYAVGIANTVWAVITTYYSRAAPLIVAVLNPGVRKLGQGEIDALDQALQGAQQHTIQNIIVRNFDLKVLDGTARIPDPTPFLKVAGMALAYETGIPFHELFGSAAGELASSQEDTRRKNQKITRRRNNHARASLREWYDLVEYWGLAKKLKNARVVVTWPVLGEPTATEAADIMVKHATAVSSWPIDRLPYPKSFVDYEVGTAPAFPKPNAPSPPNGPGEPADPDDPTDPADPNEPEDPDEPAVVETGREAEDPVEATGSPEFLLVAQRLQNTIQDLILGMAEGVLARFGLEPAQAPGANGAKPKRDVQDPADPRVQVILQFKAPSKELEAALFDAYLQAAQTAGQVTLASLGKPGVTNLLTQGEVSAFKLLAQTKAASTASRLTDEIRSSIAEGILEGEGVAALRQRVVDVFGRFSKAEANRIAMTEGQAAYNLGTRRAMAAAGLERWRFRATRNACLRICRPLDGRVFDLNDASAPHPPRGTHPHCGCTPAPVLEQEVLTR